MGTFHRSLHAQTRKLAESGRDRDQSLQPPMPWTTADWGHRRATPPDQSMEPPHQSRQDQHPLEVHPKTSASHTSLLIHAVTALVAAEEDPAASDRLAMSLSPPVSSRSASSLNRRRKTIYLGLGARSRHFAEWSASSVHCAGKFHQLLLIQSLLIGDSVAVGPISAFA